MADTTNATYDGGIDVPHRYLSGAKISIIPETSKQFPKFNKKQRDAGPEIPRPLCIELLQDLCTVVNTWLSHHHQENENDFGRNVLANLVSNVLDIKRSRKQ